MAILQLQANLPVLLGSFRGVVTVYIRNYGGGNLRLGVNKEDLINSNPTIAPPGAIVDGIPQAAAAGIQQYFWSGDLWAISDVAGPIMALIPAQSFYLERDLSRTNPANVDNTNPADDLSTY